MYGEHSRHDRHARAGQEAVRGHLLQQALGVVEGGEELEAAAVGAQEAQHALLQLRQPALPQHLLRRLRSQAFVLRQGSFTQGGARTCSPHTQAC